MSEDREADQVIKQQKTSMVHNILDVPNSRKPIKLKTGSEYGSINDVRVLDLEDKDR